VPRGDRLSVSDAAKGRWRGILPALGVEAVYLTGRHGPCPACGGKDRFRWDNREGRGTWYCNICGAGDGVSLLMAVNGWDFTEAAQRVEAVMGDFRVETNTRPEMTDEQRRAALNSVWSASRPIEPGDAADRYLRKARGIERVEWPKVLRIHDKLPHKDKAGATTYWPALVAMVQGIDGKPASIHRTWLAEDGPGKAPVDEPRKLMAGSLPEGYAIRLDEPAEKMVVAEGIETAFSAAALWRCPAWATISAQGLSKWQPPEGVRQVIIAGDADAKFAGQIAAFTLGWRLIRAEYEVTVEIPGRIGEDWNDVLRGMGG